MGTHAILAIIAQGVEAREDGRQSERAAAICRGTMRMLHGFGLTALPEVPLASGRRADLVAIDARGGLTIVEIKSSVADFRADRKWPEYRAFCDRLFFAVGPDFPLPLLPEDVGIIRADNYGAVIVREAPLHPLATAARRKMTLCLARIGAQRLHRLQDPEFAPEIG